jgi:peptidoglycan/LPS O-acetylase OafA/YrhL
MSSPSQTRTDTGRRQAIWLVAPSLLVAVATVLLLPWLLETRQRLDNAYWEGQLCFAAISLGVAAAGVPFVILRLLRRVPFVCHLGWLVVAAGYLTMTIYMFQSHFPGISQFILGSLGVAGLLIAIRGLVADIRHTDSVT